MEAHPMRDLLGTLYSQYFVSYLKYNTTTESQIFALSFLFWGAYLTENKELLEIYYHKLSKLKVTEEIHVIPAGFKSGIDLLYADIIKDEELFSKKFSEMKSLRNKMIKASQNSVCSFEYSVLEVLILTNRTKEIQYLLDHNTLQIDAESYFIPQERKQMHDEIWKILCAVAYYKLGDLERSKMYFEWVNLNLIDIGWEKYYSILYYSLQSELDKEFSQNKGIKTLNKLIVETDFTQLKNIFNKEKSSVK